MNHRSDGSGSPGDEPAAEARLVGPAGEAGAPTGPGPGPAAGWRRLRNWVSALRERPHTPQESLRFSLIVLGALAVAYWFTQWPLPRLLSSHPDFNYYLVQPVIWLGIAALAGYGWQRLAGRPPFRRLLVGIAFLVGVFHVAVLVIAGVIWDFGDSMIAGKLVNYPKNLWYITTLLAGAEVARAYLFQVWRERSRAVAFGLVTAIFFALATSAGQWTPFESVPRAFEVVGGRWLPALALSVLCTWLVSIGGIGPSFGYRFALVAFEWFSPILPNLDWPVLMVIGVGVPVVASWMIEAIYRDSREAKRLAPAAAGEEQEAAAPAEAAKPKRGWWFWTSWVLTIAVLAAGVLFFTGFMGFKMVTIDGISMEPAYSRGDVAIVREGVDPGSLAEGDVILYRRGDLPVVHRIVAIDEGQEGRVFTTKGDNVEDTDPTVTEDQIEGKVVFLIPGVGYLNLWLRGR